MKNNYAHPIALDPEVYVRAAKKVLMTFNVGPFKDCYVSACTAIYEESGQHYSTFYKAFFREVFDLYKGPAYGFGDFDSDCAEHRALALLLCAELVQEPMYCAGDFILAKECPWD